MWKVTVFVCFSISILLELVYGIELPTTTKFSSNLNSTFEKLQSCTYDSECEEFDERCINGVCVVPPDSSEEFEVPETPTISKTIKETIENSTFGKAITTALSKAKVDNCSEDTDCSANHICLNNVCVPTPISPQTVDSVAKSIQETVPSVFIGSKCQTNDECKGTENAICLEDVCQCAQKYVTSVTANSCLLKAVKEGDECELDKQCENVEKTLCIKGKCVKPAMLGGLLDTVANISSNIQKSVGGVLSAAKPEKCSEDSDCPKNYKCLNEECVVVPVSTAGFSLDKVGKAVQDNKSSGSTIRISEFIAAIFLIKLCFV